MNLTGEEIKKRTLVELNSARETKTNLRKLLSRTK